MDTPVTSGDKQGIPKYKLTQFKKGQSGNPKGRTKGTRHGAIVALEAIGKPHAEQLVLKAIELALKGDTVAIKILLDRLWPVRKGVPMTVDLPEIRHAGDLVSAMRALVARVGDGTITPEEGSAMASLLEAQRRAIETAQLEERLAVIEGRLLDQPSGRVQDADMG